MVPIYIKLGTADHYEDDRLGFLLDETNGPVAAVLDYNNLTPEIFQGLNAGLIVQITEEEFYGLQTEPTPPINVDTNYLITLSNFIPPCPTNGFVMFGYYDSKWWKITWQTIKECLGGTSTLSNVIKFRIGNAGNPVWVPAAESNTFQHDDLIGITPELCDKILVLLNGVELHHKSYYDNGVPNDVTDFNWYEIDDETGDFTMNLNFADKDILSIR